MGILGRVERDDGNTPKTSHSLISRRERRYAQLFTKHWPKVFFQVWEENHHQSRQDFNNRFKRPITHNESVRMTSFQEIGNTLIRFMVILIIVSYASRIKENCVLENKETAWALSWLGMYALIATLRFVIQAVAFYLVKRRRNTSRLKWLK